LPSRERGVVLIFVLIVLVILSIGAVALIRSTNSTLFSAGNLSFRRDLMNQGEQAVSKVLAQFDTGGILFNATTVNMSNANYSATALTPNNQGIPTVLLDDANFVPAGFAAPDLTGPTSDIKIRYVIDRLCSTTGPSTSLACVQSSAAPTGTKISSTSPVKPPTATVYRLTVRVSGARNTQVFSQTTFSKPD
jgi:Tfp pilus assembly protein PilX